MLLIGFGNKARHGKDTAAEAIRDFYNTQTANRRAHVPSYKGVTVGLFKYATALYQEVNIALSVDIWKHRTVGNPAMGDQVFELPDWVQPDPNPEINSLAPYGKHPKLLQWWGTEFRRRNFGENYWVEKTFANIPANLDIALISDVRFPNEADTIKQRGGYTVNVQRLREDGTQYMDPSRPADHPSETALDGYNWNFYLKIPHGHAALTAESAIMLAEYLRGLHK